ncbi:hypothetical protein ACFFIO_00225 [Citricoccus parietis]|uniref:Tyr recombinase domain-containing protein n=2 Tax=Citricoccus parietis TaxID=592307 RepID=A0ABV6F093_9MICC
MKLPATLVRALKDHRKVQLAERVQFGAPARVVMEILGHSAIKLSMDTYSHVMLELMADAVDRVETVLQKSVPGPAEAEMLEMPEPGNE